MKPLVSVIVVNHNRRRLLIECLQSLVQQSFQEREILVVDNGSQDGSRQTVRSFEGQGVRLIALDSNVGFAAANNAGALEARGELLALLNNDAIAHRDWLRYLVNEISRNPQVGMCACKILLHEATVIDKAGHLIYWDGQNRGRGTGQADRGQFDRRQPVLLPDGCAALYRLSMWKELGGMDEDFFAYADDADLGLRARWRGYGCLYVPQAVVRHRQSSTTALYSGQKVYWVERNRMWLAVKNFPPLLLFFNPIFTLIRWLWNLWACLRGRGAAAAFRRENSVSSLLSTLARAYVDGLLGLPRMWRKRRKIRHSRRLTDREFLRLLWRYRISARRLAFEDRPEGVGREARA